MNSKGSSQSSSKPQYVPMWYANIKLEDGTLVHCPNRRSKDEAVKDAAKYFDLLLGNVESFYICPV